MPARGGRSPLDTVSGLKQRANFQPTLDTLKLQK